MKLGDYDYKITNKDVKFIKTTDEFLVTVELVAKNSFVDPEIGEISVSFATTTPTLNNVVTNVPILFFIAEQVETYGTIEFYEDGSIYCHGRISPHWGNSLPDNVEFEFEIKGA